MRYAFTAVLSVALVACSSLQPVPIRTGDKCFRCGRVITDPKLAVQLVSADGQPSNFRTPGCFAKYLKTYTGEIKTIFVTDYPSGEMIPVTKALFVRATIDQETGERDFYAFGSASVAAKRAEEAGSAAVDWSTVRTLADMKEPSRRQPSPPAWPADR